MMNLPTMQAPIHKKPLLLYLATNLYAIGALIAQEDRGGIEQPVYYISRALKNVETRYPRAERTWSSAILHQPYFAEVTPLFLGLRSMANDQVLCCQSFVAATDPLCQNILVVVTLSQYDLKAEMPKVIKSQAIAHLLAQFSGEEEFPLDDEVPGEVAMVEEVKEQWVMKFDGSSTAQSGGVEVVFYHEENETVALSFKLEFPCSNNMAEYEAYLTGLVTSLEMRVKHLRVMGDSNLVVCQAKGSFSLKEPSLAPYRAMAQKMEEKFSTFEIEHAPRNGNRFADALATLGSQIIFEGDSTRIEVGKRKKSIIETLKERFQEE
ncbi:uncharacterized protein LOC126703783 [Quercus robur]|uniref:uncharacterized protein LOC126703783 n=1 Tax=Quercus robur TaxID=38942 RepID=UPI002161F93C|nr:uncharacterized protein LOC126703783 [Quercus robur]